MVVASKPRQLVGSAKVEFLAGKNVLIVGLGKSGKAAAALCATGGALLSGMDRKARTDFPEECEELECLGMTLHLAGHPALGKYDIVITSPGIPRNHPAILSAREDGVPVWGETELAARCAGCHLVSITGTDGKSTTCTLVTDVLRAHRKRTLLGGNIGVPFSELLLRKEFVHSPHVVLEVSSYQLEHIECFKPEVAAILNIAPDHVKHHGSMKAYRQAKWRIVQNMDEHGFIVLRNDLAAEVPDDLRPSPLYFGLSDEGREGAFWVKNKIVWRYGGETIRCSASRMGSLAPPEQENFLAALTVAMAAGGELQKSLSVLKRFKPLPHRLEEVGEWKGIHFVNDSKATNVHSALAALDSLPAQIVWIAGGQSKDEDFSPLVEASRAKVRSAVLLGETANTMAANLVDATSVHRVSSMKDAVARACRLAKPGDTVLLAPACSSFDMYTSFEERGKEFCRLVTERMR